MKSKNLVKLLAYGTISGVAVGSGVYKALNNELSQELDATFVYGIPIIGGIIGGLFAESEDKYIISEKLTRGDLAALILQQTSRGITTTLHNLIS